MSQMKIETVVSTLFPENTYVLWRQGDTRAVVVDPGFDPDKIERVLYDYGLSPEAILLTHGHSDHIAGNGYLKERWPDCPLVIGHGDQAKLTDPVANLSAQFGVGLVSPPADRTVGEGDVLEYASFRFEVFDTPGHSAGHVVFLFDQDGSKHVLGGDVLFRGGIGRTDFPDGSFSQLQESIQQKLFPLPDDTVVYPGHGPTTTIGHEREFNPFVGRASSRLA